MMVAGSRFKVTDAMDHSVPVQDGNPNSFTAQSQFLTLLLDGKCQALKAEGRGSRRRVKSHRPAADMWPMRDRGRWKAICPPALLPWSGILFSN